VAFLATQAVNGIFLSGDFRWPDIVAAQLVNIAAGMLLGATLFGLYLFVSANLFAVHTDGAFSALRIADYKHFLRLHITDRGVLEIFPIGMTRVPRAGAARGEYFLIEGPIRIDPRSIQASGPPGARQAASAAGAGAPP
jgi:hypothetical protein